MKNEICNEELGENTLCGNLVLKEEIAEGITKCILHRGINNKRISEDKMNNNKIKKEVLKTFEVGKYKPTFKQLMAYQIEEAIDLTLKKQQDEFLKLIDKWCLSYDKNHPIFFESVERLKQKVKELKQ